MSEKNWYLICYDIRSPKRWAKTYKLLKGRGEHLQYSIFRLYMNKTQLETLRWEIGKILKKEDDFMAIKLCPGCAANIIDLQGRKNWKKPDLFAIL